MLVYLLTSVDLRWVTSQINNNTDRKLYFVFSKFRGFSFTITLTQKPQRSYAYAFSLSQGYYERKTPKNSSVLSVLLLIYDADNLFQVLKVWPYSSFKLQFECFFFSQQKNFLYNSIPVIIFRPPPPLPSPSTHLQTYSPLPIPSHLPERSAHS